MAFRKLFSTAALALCMAAPAPAALVYDYELNGSLANGVGGADIVTEGGTLEATGYSFGPSQGLAIANSLISGVYTIDLKFSFARLEADWQKIIDFADLSSDAGLYTLKPNLSFYPVITGNTLLVPGELTEVRLTRDATGLFSAYVNGVFEFSFDDSVEENAVFAPGVMRFFHDDFATGEAEAGAGFVDYIRVYDEVLAQPAVPEPASWAMMIAGMALVGGCLRSRRIAIRFA